jgi:hypothetical protein
MLEEVYDLEPHLGRAVLAQDDLGPLYREA